ncbi:MAG: DUF5119 domain-containing protein [Muribaculaceae bacterium]|nr:DUF5119 domain-containing protein [Muribaculaceae bacterium]
MMKKFMRFILLLSAVATLTSCHHKDLYYDDVELRDIKIVFDWRNAPDADPTSMEVFLFDSSASNEIRFNFPNRIGGSIELEPGQYSGLGINSDISDWAHTRNIDNIETFEIYTDEVSELSAYNLDPTSLPKARGAAEERIVATPRMLWSGREDSITVTDTPGQKVITFYPKEDVCHYTVDVINVKNIENIQGIDVDGTISGMAESYLHGKHKPTDTSATMPFNLSVNDNKDSLHSEFLTFGESSETANAHILSLYIIMTDGAKLHYTFDVTSQIHNAPDPQHVHIVVSGIELPKTIETGEGFVPEVNDWQSEHVNIMM